MIDAKFEYGTEVRVVRNIRNDGSFPGCAKGSLLIRRGSTGYVRQAGLFLQEQVIYQVHFLQRGLTIGCKETELCLASDNWLANTFEYGDKAELAIRLASEGKTLAQQGDVVSILGVQRNNVEAATYKVQYQDMALSLPERALRPLNEAAYVE